MKIEDFKDRHIGDSCALLGNGPSLSRYDLSKVDDHILLIGINRSWIDPALQYPNARPEKTKYHYASDIVHAEEFEQGLFDTEVFFHRHIWALKASGCIRRKVEKFVDIADLFKQWKGKYAGPVALRLALYMGFSEIWLLGFDLIDGEEKFYDSVPGQGEIRNNMYARQRRRFNEISREVPHWVSIHNCNIRSALTRFPFMERKDWLRE